jgi:hypothetical protein
MSAKTVYVGTYYKVWMPMHEEQSMSGLCLHCDKTRQSPYCPCCGKAIVYEKTMVLDDPHDFIEKTFENVNTFCVKNAPGGSNCFYILGNLVTQKGFVYATSEFATEINIPHLSMVNTGDWAILDSALHAANIQHGRCYSILVYWD